MLASSSYIHLMTLDFSNAFDTVRHPYLSDSLHEIPIPDNILDHRFPQETATQYQVLSITSVTVEINASIVQESGLGSVIVLPDIFPLQLIIKVANSD